MTLIQQSCKFWISLGLSALTMGTTPGLLVMLSATSLHAASPTPWSFDPNTDQLEVTLPAGVTPRYFMLAQPARIVLDVPTADQGAIATQHAYSGAVRTVRVSEFEPGITRIVLELAPEVELAPGQVSLQAVTPQTATTESGQESGQVRWALRPLLANANLASANLGRENLANPNLANDLANADTAEPAVLGTSSPTTMAIAESQLLPVPFVPQLKPDTALTEDASVAAGIPLPFSAAAMGGEAAPVLVGTGADTLLTQPASSDLVPSEFSTQPVFPSVAAPATAPLPSLEPNAIPIAVEPVSGSTQPMGAIAQNYYGLPPALPEVRTPATVTVPPPTLGTPSPTIIPQSIPSATTSPAPAAIPYNQSQAPVQQFNPNALVPAGTIMFLRYPGSTPLALTSREEWQEVLLVNSPVYDPYGRLVIPVGSQVIGRFETRSGGRRRFIAQAVTLNNRNILVEAESNSLGGDRDVSERDLIRNSAIGAAGVGLLGALTGGIGLLGILAGAAGGAATTFITAPQEVTIQPNQVFEVRFTQDVLRPF
ncbi:AMIN domain-containing protein [Leptolyngbya sp. AN02str]|uniref:AMIN domain-containing protein n=1 Tax=Leptolyngbya sp. AN02str TaxID=3423363 RepID=UPI003D31F88F